MKISINEPCHERWESMTPNAQGAFCGSCQKNVVDFSKMSIAGIKEFFSKPQEGRVCGRFEEKQLQELSFDDFFAKFRYWSFGKKFATIFILAFGFWIFSSPGAMAQTHHVRGYAEQPRPVEQVQPVHTEEPVMLQGQPVLMGKPTVQDPPKKMGKVKCVEPKEKELKGKKKEKKQKTQKPLPHIMGDIAMPEEIINKSSPESKTE